MKRLNTDLTTSDVGLVLQHKHLDFIQDKTEESLIHSIYSQLGRANTGVVILYGCIPTFTTTTTTDDTLTITAGAISYQGKIYEVAAATMVKTGSNVHVLKLLPVTYDASDPSLFTDNVSRDVQEVRVVALSVQASGAGISDWSSVVFLSDKLHYIGLSGEPPFQNSWSNTGIDKAYFTKDKSGFVHIHANVRGGYLTTAVFNLPIGYRPSVAMDFGANSFAGSNIISVNGAGAVTISTLNGGGVTNVYFDITFKAV